MCATNYGATARSLDNRGVVDARTLRERQPAGATELSPARTPVRACPLTGACALGLVTAFH